MSDYEHGQPSRSHANQARAMQGRLLCLVLVEDAAMKQRSLTYSQILPRIGFSSEFDSIGRQALTRDLLPSLGHWCARRGAPLLSCLAVSADTRKPESWFKILVVHELGWYPESISSQDWAAFVNAEQLRAVEHWSGPAGVSLAQTIRARVQRTSSHD